MSKTQVHSIHPLNTKKNNFQNPRCITSCRQFQSPQQSNSAYKLIVASGFSSSSRTTLINLAVRVALRLSTSLSIQLMQHLTSPVMLTRTPPKPQLSLLLTILGFPVALLTGCSPCL
ncbi:hypothetical protein GOP47_0009020 [Adiantum capillus-veneris]|uniref:Uncharacterized protein n=1 Tax=Adiantum capillus-veneris TaxID=13818 RepID=A0A9D4V023_ADICA|nr:hypothetical protein GOP47_0009020 [Adiantum capillus-veneris]